MQIVKPISVTNADIVSTTAATSLYSAWNSGTAYTHTPTPDRVYYNEHDWEAVANSTGITPGTDATKWLDLGASNKFAMFDGIIGTITTASSTTLDVEINTGELVNGVVFFGLVGNSITIQMDDPTDGIVYDETILLNDYSGITTGYAYYFSDVNDRISDLAVMDLPNYTTASLIISIDNGASPASVTEMVLGTKRVLGLTNFGTTISIKDYSIKDTDDFGNYVITQRRFAKLCDYDCTFDSIKVASIQKQLASIRATPTVFIGNEDLPETIIYGFYKDFSIVLSGPSVSQGSIQVEGLV